MTNLATDNFTRTNQSGWGTASDGINAWSTVRGSGITYSIASNLGAASGNSNSYGIQRCGSGTSADTEQVVIFTRSSTSDMAGVVFRYASNNNYYAVQIGGFVNNLVFEKMIAGVYSQVAFGGSHTYATGTTWAIRVQNIGTALRARIWDTSGAEPGTFDINTTDSSLSAAGNFGIYTDPAGAPVVNFSSYTVTDGNNVVTTNINFTDGLSASDNFSSGGSYLPIDAATITESLSSGDAASWVEALSAADSVANSKAIALLDSLVPVDQIAGSGAVSFTEALSGGSAFSGSGSTNMTDGLLAADSFANNTAMTTQAPLSASDTMFTMRSASYQELLSILDRLTVATQPATVAPPSLRLIANYRTGTVAALYRSGEVAATYRDGEAVARGGR